MRNVLTFILAGGKGERLNPLTKDRAKPAVPFGGIYRIIDVTLSNCINSGLRRIFILTQYKSFSLQKHLLSGWMDIVSSQLGEFIDLIPAQQRVSSDWYLGTADAIYQNMYAISDHDPHHILILAGDHVYKMNYGEMFEVYKKLDADVVVSCIPMPAETSTLFGVIEVDDEFRVVGFQEKPKNPKTIPGQPDKILASMGIYLFRRESLCEALELDAENPDSHHDFGKNIIPQMIQNNRRVYAFNFVDPTGEPGYWRDIGTRDAYYQANMDLVRPEPLFNIHDKKWPIRTNHMQYPPIKAVSMKGGNGQIFDTSVINSLVAGGCILEGARIEGSILSPNVRVGCKSEVMNSVIMNNVTIGEDVQIKNAIIDKEVVIPPGVKIGYDLENDRKRFDVTTSGVVILEKRQPIKTPKTKL
ncbi:MAG: glucose-1-phosphate adenylyltransferase [Candidatus Omnitrophota bacterium]